MDPIELILKQLESPGYAGNFSTALHYLKQFEPCFSGEGGICPAQVFGGASLDQWNKELDAARNRLVFHNQDMVLDEKKIRTSGLSTPRALMEFDHVITTTAKDRDNDVIETKGVEVDSKMPLLWHHMQIQPLGPFLGVTQQDEKILSGKSAILDTKMGTDAAVLVEGGALRISQGFRPIEAAPFVEKSGDKDIVRGWHIKKSHTLEVSLVSVPANSDAVITAHSRGKLHSPLFQKWAGMLDEKRPKSVFPGIDVSALPETVVESGYSFNYEAQRWMDKNGKFVSGEMVIAKAGSSQQAETGDSMKGKKCPGCGKGKLDKTGTCSECGYVEGKGDGKSAALSPEQLAMLAESGLSADDVRKVFGFPLVTKFPHGFGRDLSGSMEWVQGKLAEVAPSYLNSAGIDTPAPRDGYVEIGATFSDSAIICVHRFQSMYTASKCYQSQYGVVDGELRFSGKPNEVEATAEVKSKMFADIECRNLADRPLREIAKHLACQLITADEDEAAAVLSEILPMKDALDCARDTELLAIY